MNSRHKTDQPGSLRYIWQSFATLAVLVACVVIPAGAIEGSGRFDLDAPEDGFVEPQDTPAFREFRRTLGNSSPQAIPRSPAGDLLEASIIAHNHKSADALRHWLRMSLNPSISDADVDKRLGWYVEAIEMFGPLSQEPLAVVEDEPHRLLVHLVRTDMGPRERFDPLNIVVVELDVDDDNPRYLARGLGLASLACEARKLDADDPSDKH